MPESFLIEIVTADSDAAARAILDQKAAHLRSAWGRRFTLYRVPRHRSSGWRLWGADEMILIAALDFGPAA